MQKKIDKTIRFSTKRVWIGDPCYVIQDELWDDVCEQIKNNVITVNYKGNDLSFIMCETAFGDGCYDSQTGFEYGVDCGCLAIVLEELIREDYDYDDPVGKLFDIETYSISLKTDGKGTFIFSDGTKVIETIWTDEFAEEKDDEG